MSNTFKHKIEGKCRNKILKWKEAPRNMQNKWDRSNGEWGEFRALKKQLVEKIMNKEMKDYG
jgi:hypothetical protein